MKEDTQMAKKQVKVRVTREAGTGEEKGRKEP